MISAPLQILGQNGTVDQYYYWITLQLVDTYQTAPKAAGSKYTIDLSKGMVIADFYDVVYPSFFALNVDGSRRAWDTWIWPN